MQRRAMINKNFIGEGFIFRGITYQANKQVFVVKQANSSELVRLIIWRPRLMNL